MEAAIHSDWLMTTLSLWWAASLLKMTVGMEGKCEGGALLASSHETHDVGSLLHNGTHGDGLGGAAAQVQVALSARAS